ncbi:MAG: C1 family peptidase [Prevotella sp.]|nr:C1 family peptidase [Prevotella sp.]MDD7461011.1 C1 family peptidase [Prevotellaceae bacterium]MDY3365399.1 C1 family peptidase [Prevotella sp.]
MKKILVLALVAMLFTGADAKSKKKENKKTDPVFTVVKENKITSIKDQNRSGTCWAYSGLSFFESEILKKTGKEYNLSEMFVAHRTYFDRATATVRMHGDISFSQGGSFEDGLVVAKTYGLVPESAMAAPGSLTGDSLANFGEFFDLMTPYVEAVAKSKSKKISGAWKNGLNGILDSYLGKCPESFTYEGKTYTPQSFASSLGLNWDDYICITSYTHHPMWSAFAVEVQDNWRWGLSYNVPIDDLCRIIDNAIMNGYTVAWGGDVTEDGFTRKGLGILVDAKKVRSMAGTDADRWFKLSASEKKEKYDALGINAPEIVPTQEMRQEAFDNWETTDDHGMHIYGIAKDQNGKEYYMVKNSWGTYGDYKGTWYMTKNYVALKTMDYMINKNAVPQDILDKLGIK